MIYVHYTFSLPLLFCSTKLHFPGNCLNLGCHISVVYESICHGTVDVFLISQEKDIF